MKFAVTPDIEIHFCKQIFPCVQHFLEMIVFCYHVLSNLLKIYDVFQIMFHEMVSVDGCFKLKLNYDEVNIKFMITLQNLNR